MILFIYPFGQRFRQLAPNAHTLAEVMHARHGSSSQLIMAFSNLLGSVVSLTANFTAAGALVVILSPMPKHASMVERTRLFVSLAKVDNAGTEAAMTGLSSLLSGIDAQRRLP